MKKSITFLFLLGIAALLGGGCASSGLSASTHRTDVQLSSNNYRIVAMSVSGEASSDGILGVSIGVGFGATQFSLIPLSHDRTLYKNAVENLWKNFELKNGSPVNRTLALVNFRYDAETLNTFLYTKVKVVVIADVVEFK